MAVKTLKEALGPIRWLNCIFCMGVFEIPINRPRFLLSAFYVVLASIGYIVLLYKGIEMFEEVFSNEFIIFYFVVTVNVIVASSAVILFWWKSENLNNIIKRSSIADLTLEALGIKRNYPKIFRSIVYLMIAWLLAMILLNIMHVMWMYRDVGYWFTIYTDICFCLPIMINSVVDLTFTSCIRCIQVKFQNTNILLNNVVLCANESYIYKIHDDYENKPIKMVRTHYKNRKDKILHLIQTLRHLHQEITRIARTINNTFCLQLLLELAVHFTIVTATTYCLYSTFAGNLSLQITGEKIVAMIVWGCVYSFKIIFVNYLCANISDEAYKTGEIIQSFGGPLIDDDIKEEIHQFTQQIVLCSLKFTAFRFFTLDNCLTGKFFATVTTYVVLLIQMNAPTSVPISEYLNITKDNA